MHVAIICFNFNCIFNQNASIVDRTKPCWQSFGQSFGQDRRAEWERSQQEWRTASVQQECPTVPHCVCGTRVPLLKSVFKSVKQECRTKVRCARASFEERQARVSNNVWLCVFACVCAFGFVGVPQSQTDF